MLRTLFIPQLCLSQSWWCSTVRKLEQKLKERFGGTRGKGSNLQRHYKNVNNKCHLKRPLGLSHCTKRRWVIQKAVGIILWEGWIGVSGIAATIPGPNFCCLWVVVPVSLHYFGGCWNKVRRESFLWPFYLQDLELIRKIKKQRKFWIQLASKFGLPLQAAPFTHLNSHTVFGALLAFTQNIRQERFLKVLNPITMARIIPIIPPALQHENNIGILGM